MCSTDGCVLGRPGGSFGYGLWLLLGASFCLRPHYTFSSSCQLSNILYYVFLYLDVNVKSRSIARFT